MRIEQQRVAAHRLLQTSTSFPSIFASAQTNLRSWPADRKTFERIAFARFKPLYV